MSKFLIGQRVEVIDGPDKGRSGKIINIRFSRIIEKYVYSVGGIFCEQDEVDLRLIKPDQSGIEGRLKEFEISLPEGHDGEKHLLVLLFRVIFVKVLKNNLDKMPSFANWIGSSTTNRMDAGSSPAGGNKIMRGGAVAARVAHNHEVDGSNPSPAIRSLFRVITFNNGRVHRVKFKKNDTGKIILLNVLKRNLSEIWQVFKNENLLNYFNINDRFVASVEGRVCCGCN